MQQDQAQRLIEIHKELEDALNMKIQINHEQVHYITTTSLLGKYDGALKRGCNSDVAAFEQVLKYYLSEDELVATKEALLA